MEWTPKISDSVQLQYQLKSYLAGCCFTQENQLEYVYVDPETGESTVVTEDYIYNLSPDDKYEKNVVRKRIVYPIYFPLVVELLEGRYLDDIPVTLRTYCLNWGYTELFKLLYIHTRYPFSIYEMTIAFTQPYLDLAKFILENSSKFSYPLIAITPTKDYTPVIIKQDKTAAELTHFKNMLYNVQYAVKHIETLKVSFADRVGQSPLEVSFTNLIGRSSLIGHCASLSPEQLKKQKEDFITVENLLKKKIKALQWRNNECLIL